MWCLLVEESFNRGSTVNLTRCVSPTLNPACRLGHIIVISYSEKKAILYRKKLFFGGGGGGGTLSTWPRKKGK